MCRYFALSYRAPSGLSGPWGDPRLVASAPEITLTIFDYTKAVLLKVFALARVGIAFNVMSKQVEWERDDLFHLPFDVLADFLTSELSRNFIFRHDYGLFEYTTYVYR